LNNWIDAVIRDVQSIAHFERPTRGVASHAAGFVPRDRRQKRHSDVSRCEIVGFETVATSIGAPLRMRA
jgi:hypothetical protein